MALLKQQHQLYKRNSKLLAVAISMDGDHSWQTKQQDLSVKSAENIHS